MSVSIYIHCDCTPKCDTDAMVDDARTDTDARIALHRRGWDCDTVGGNTVDLAPGHTWERAA